jgi:hypothetical protein
MPRAKKRPSRKSLRQQRSPDVRSPKFAAEAHRQSRAVARSRHAVKDQAFIDAISETK